MVVIAVILDSRCNGLLALFLINSYIQIINATFLVYMYKELQLTSRSCSIKLISVCEVIVICFKSIDLSLSTRALIFSNFSFGN